MHEKKDEKNENKKNQFNILLVGLFIEHPAAMSRAMFNFHLKRNQENQKHTDWEVERENWIRAKWMRFWAQSTTL